MELVVVRQERIMLVWSKGCCPRGWAGAEKSRALAVKCNCWQASVTLMRIATAARSHELAKWLWVLASSNPSCLYLWIIFCTICDTRAYIEASIYPEDRGRNREQFWVSGKEKFGWSERERQRKSSKSLSRSKNFHFFFFLSEDTAS